LEDCGLGARKILKRINENHNYTIRRITPNNGKKDGFIGTLLCKC
jgi:hypothetical protein